MFKLCPCCSQKEFSLCCSPLISGQTVALTALDLMRSRYCAYLTHNIDYLISTWHADYRYPGLADSIAGSFEHTQWQSLTIVSTTPTVANNPNESYVEFIAKFYDTQTAQSHAIHERSHFIKQGEYWYYTSGIKPTVGRNVPCPCGSMKKYKKCCGK